MYRKPPKAADVLPVFRAALQESRFRGPDEWSIEAVARFATFLALWNAGSEARDEIKAIVDHMNAPGSPLSVISNESRAVIRDLVLSPERRLVCHEPISSN